jgi:hypothetical protein
MLAKGEYFDVNEGGIENIFEKITQRLHMRIA